MKVRKNRGFLRGAFGGTNGFHSANSTVEWALSDYCLWLE